MAGPRLGAAAEAAEARARPGLTLRPFAPFSGAAEADEGGGDWSFIDCEMEEVDLQDLPSATIACHLDSRVFVDGLCRVRAGPGVGAEGGHLLPGGGGAGQCADVRAARAGRGDPGTRPQDAAPPPAAVPSPRAGLGGSRARGLCVRAAASCYRARGSPVPGARPCFPATPLRPVVTGARDSQVLETIR